MCLLPYAHALFESTVCAGALIVITASVSLLRVDVFRRPDGRRSLSKAVAILGLCVGVMLIVRGVGLFITGRQVTDTWISWQVSVFTFLGWVVVVSAALYWRIPKTGGLITDQPCPREGFV
jgi:hypothetical protein